MTTNDMLTISEAMKKGELSLDETIRLSADGKIKDPNKKYSIKELKSLVSQNIGPIAEVAKPAYSASSQTSNSEVRIVKMRIPGTNIHYITLLKDGKMHFTYDDHGEFKLPENPEKCVDDIVDLLAFYSMFGPRSRNPGEKKNRKKPKKPRGPSTKPKPPTKEKPGEIFDPFLRDYLEKNAGTFAHMEQVDRESFKRRDIIIGEDLEDIVDNPEVMNALRDSNVAIFAEEITSFIGQYKSAVSKRTKKFEREVIEDPDVRQVALEMLEKYVKDKDGNPDKNKKLLRHFMSKDDNARGLYKNLIQISERKEVDDHPNYEFMICFGALSLEMVYEAKKRAGVYIDMDELKSIESTMYRWKGYAQASDFVTNDQQVQEDIIPILENKEGEEIELRERLYDVSCKFGKLIVEEGYYPDTLKKIVNGLWMEGFMEESDDGVKESRPVRSIQVEYLGCLNNLLTRYNIYNNLLWGAYSKSLEDGLFDDRGVNLKEQRKCANMGDKLYHSLSQEDQNNFSDIRNINKPLIPDGSQRMRITRAWVGINKEKILEVYQKRVNSLDNES